MVAAYGGFVSLITVVSVVKDDAPGLRLTLDSFGPKPTPDSRILVLDGSADRDVIPKLLALYPFLETEYHWSPPTGVYGAMNDALNLVQSQYVYFLNAGDTLASDRVPSKLQNSLAKSSPIWAIGRVLFFSENGERLTEPPWSYERERKRLFARGVFPAHQGVVAQTEALRQQGGFDLKFRITADYVSILKLARESAPLELDFPLASFHQGGLSTSEWRLSLREFHRARMTVFRPSGLAAMREVIDTVRLHIRTYAFHSLRRLRTRPSSPAAEYKPRLEQ